MNTNPVYALLGFNKLIQTQPLKGKAPEVLRMTFVVKQSS